MIYEVFHFSLTREDRMQDVELESLIQEAGYMFVPATGRYVTTDAEEADVDYATEDIADQLEIPIDDLVRWEQEQVTAEEGAAE
jgi:3-polyprenyl-4-hydroxybenzoate decarboxylase